MFVTHHQADFTRAVEQLGIQIIKRFEQDSALYHVKQEDILLVGIRTCGAHLAKRLQVLLEKYLDKRVELGVLDIGLYRDDTHLPSSGSLHIRTTSLPASLENRYIVLVDDVLYTGRTIRAALQALLDFGRPSCVRLAVMVDRSCHELPISADFKSLDIIVQEGETVEIYMVEEGHKEDTIVRVRSKHAT